MTEHEKVVEKIIREYPSEPPLGVTVMNIRLRELSEYITGGKGKKSGIVYEYAFMMWQIMVLLLSKKLLTTQLSDGTPAVWINHGEFLKRNTHHDISKITLRRWIAVLKNDLGLIGSYMKYEKGVAAGKCFYYLTPRGLELFEKHTLKNYQNLLKDYTS